MSIITPRGIIVIEDFGDSSFYNLIIKRKKIN